MADTIKVKFTRDASELECSDDERSKYVAGAQMDLEADSAHRWVRRGAAEIVTAGSGKKPAAAAKASAKAGADDSSK